MGSERMSLNGELRGHEHFGELAALATLGQVSPAEYLELKAHLESCSACRVEYAVLADLQITQLPLAHSDSGSPMVDPVLEMPSNGHSRLHGLESSASPVHSRPPVHLRWLREKTESRKTKPSYAYAAVAILAIAAGVLGLKLFNSVRINGTRSAEVVRLNSQVLQLRDQVQTLSSRETSAPGARATSKTTTQSEPDYTKLLARNRELESQLQAASDEVASLKSQIDSGAGKEADLSARLSEAQDALTRMGAQMQSLEDAHAQDAQTIHDQQDQLNEVGAKLATTTDSIDRDKKLLMADRDIRDLMGARNLRIIDVFDVDGKGRTRKPFGRVFFTEGKSLIFYAFDLERDPTAAQAASYQAWGYEGTYQQGVQSLGIFYQDDQNANRWVLKFDDPEVLAEIDSVFVTIEPRGGSNKPTGSKLLAAYLKANLNHP